MSGDDSTPHLVERSIRVRCSPQHAFLTFTSRIDLWWPVSHRRFERGELTLEPCVGGRFFDRSPEGEVAVLGEVVRWAPPHALVYTWRPGAISAPTTVEVRFTEDGTHTRVDVAHHEGDAALGERWSERAQLFVRGWIAVLGALESTLEASADEDAT